MLSADGGKLFPLDLLAGAAINRSLSNCSAFTLLVRENNYLAAASLVRLQIDSFLRFHAAYLVDDPSSFAISVLAGDEIRKLKDQTGAKMQDWYLAKSASSDFPWVERVYKATSGFIHLSEKHIFSTMQSVHEDRKISLYIGSDTSHIPNPLWVEMAEGFIAATDALFHYLEGWIFTKKKPHLVQQHRDNLNKQDKQSLYQA